MGAKRAALRAAQCFLWKPRASRPSRFSDSSALEHLDRVNVDLVPVDVPGHGNVMPIVLLKGIGIVHRQNLLVFVGNNNWAGAGRDALFCAGFRTGIGSFDATLGVANPAVHGLSIGSK